MADVADPFSPPTENQFLVALLAGLRKRRKPIRHKVRSIVVEKLLERTSADEHEKLEISAEVGAARLRLFVCDDRWVFVDARRPTKNSGWAWEFTRQGRLVAGEVGPLIQALEASIEATASESREAMERVWKSLLATGPRLPC